MFRAMKRCDGMWLFRDDQLKLECLLECPMVFTRRGIGKGKEGGTISTGKVGCLDICSEEPRIRI